MRPATFICIDLYLIKLRFKTAPFCEIGCLNTPQASPQKPQNDKVDKEAFQLSNRPTQQFQSRLIDRYKRFLLQKLEHGENLQASYPRNTQGTATYLFR